MSDVYKINLAAKRAEQAMLDRCIETITEIMESHKEATQECESGCDFVIGWEAAIEALKELR